tara:strand:- start:111 stop:674 length:564 start_codon:yes stop_codon:yes gene_type:complete
MDLYNSIIVAIWLCVVYAIWAATEAGDPGYGQVAFLAGGVFAHLYLRKIRLERPVTKNDKITIPDANFSVEIPDEGDKYYFSEKSYRKIIWISTIASLILISIFIETITYQPDYLIWGIIAFIFGLIVFIIPIFLPIKDDIETLRKRAEKERIKAWRKGKFDQVEEKPGNIEENEDLKENKIPKEEE